MVSPRQLSQQRRDFLVTAVSLIELSHAEEVWSREAAETGVAARERGCELVDDTVTPLGILDLQVDVFAKLPVQRNQV
jgi:hypothetical protein